MVVGIVLIASIFVSLFLSWDSDRGIDRDIGVYFLRFLAGVSLIVFGNVTRDIATRKPSDKEPAEDDSIPTLYAIENPFDSNANDSMRRL